MDPGTMPQPTGFDHEPFSGTDLFYQEWDAFELEWTLVQRASVSYDSQTIIPLGTDNWTAEDQNSNLPQTCSQRQSSSMMSADWSQSSYPAFSDLQAISAPASVLGIRELDRGHLSKALTQRLPTPASPLAHSSSKSFSCNICPKIFVKRHLLKYEVLPLLQFG